MEIGGRGIAEGLLEEELAGGGGEQVRAADDVGDGLGVVIDDDGELVGPDAIGAEEDEVAGGFREVGGVRTLETVGKREGGIGDADAPGGGLGGIGGRVAAGAGVGGFEAGGSVGGGEFEGFAGTGAGVEKGLELGEGVLVGGGAGGLVEDGFLPGEAEVGESGEDIRGPLGAAARAIGIFHADEPGALVGAGIKVTGGCGDKGAEVEGTGGGRGETAAVHGGIFLSVGQKSEGFLGTGSEY